jgi:hypothetical protein
MPIRPCRIFLSHWVLPRKAVRRNAQLAEYSTLF